MTRPEFNMRPTAHFGLGAILAIGAAIASIACSITGRWAWGLGLGVASVPLGLVGLVQAVSPRIRGGFVSIFAVALGCVGIAVAVVVLILRIARG